ncbi:MAG: hypothetical protein NTZ11_07140 [Gammaproteobacteria bacterium]|nr:hypothetical protein [Gammaproteobacteria bacterium]
MSIDPFMVSVLDVVDSAQPVLLRRDLPMTGARVRTSGFGSGNQRFQRYRLPDKRDGRDLSSAAWML